MDKVICYKCKKEFELNNCANCCECKRERKDNLKEIVHNRPFACSRCRKTYSISPCFHLH